MTYKTLIVAPKREEVTDIDALIEAMQKSGIDVIEGDSGKLLVESASQQTAEKLLKIHGYGVESEESYLKSVVVELAEKYQLNEKASPHVDRQKLASFIRRKIKNLQTTLKRRRQQHVRDEITGQIRSLEDTLRKLKNM